MPSRARTNTMTPSTEGNTIIKIFSPESVTGSVRGWVAAVVVGDVSAATTIHQQTLQQQIQFQNTWNVILLLYSTRATRSMQRPRPRSGPSWPRPGLKKDSKLRTTKDQGKESFLFHCNHSQMIDLCTFWHEQEYNQGLSVKAKTWTKDSRLKARPGQGL